MNCNNFKGASDDLLASLEEGDDANDDDAKNANASNHEYKEEAMEENENGEEHYE